MTKQKLPKGWPKDTPLPTLEEAQEAVRKIGELIEGFKKKNKGKIKGSDDMDKVVRCLNYT